MFLRAVWADVSGGNLPIHIRTDAGKLVATAETKHLSEQKETHTTPHGCLRSGINLRATAVITKRQKMKENLRPGVDDES